MRGLGRQRIRHVWAWLLVPCLGSCQYLKDRALDFTDQYRVVIGAGSAMGIRAAASGVWDTGLMIGVKPRGSALGWRYGDPLFFNTRDLRTDADQVELILASHTTALDYREGSYYSGRHSVALLPAVFSWVDASPVGYEWHVPERGNEFRDEYWIWDPAGMRVHRYAQVHVFDAEFEIGLGIYLDVGWSPGELLDFFLGLLTLDLAGDDGRW